MPLIYSLSNPIDLQKITKKIYADTNAIVDLYYPNAALVPNNSTQGKQPYHMFIRNIFQSHKLLYITSSTLLEMENVFVKFDHKIYNAQNPPVRDTKAFRRIPSEMQKRKISYSQYYSQIFGNSMIKCIEVTITNDNVTNYLNGLDVHCLDGNDYILACHCNKENAIIITDDCDFASSIVNCDIITNNQSLVQKALSVGFTLAN